MKTHEKVFDGLKVSGFLVLLLFAIMLVATVIIVSLSKGAGIVMIAVVLLLIFVLPLGFIIIEPNNSRVLTFFGKYEGTITDNGFFWINPLFVKMKVTLRMRNLDITPIKVNDKKRKSGDDRGCVSMEGKGYL